MNNIKAVAASEFPDMTVAKLGGGEINLRDRPDGFEWHAVVVYRGKHCPICTKYLQSLNELLPKFHDLGIGVVAVSADSLERAQEQIELVNPNFDVGYDLSIEQMQQLGLYISKPRSSDESDRPFAEPGLFIMNDKGEIQVLDISNAPFARPELSSMLMGLGFIKDPANNYPIRGTY